MRYQESAVGPAMMTSRMVGVVFPLLVVAACAGGGALASPNPGMPAGSGVLSAVVAAPTTSTASSADEAARRAAVATYIEMWQAMAQAGQTSDWHSPVLAQYATGEALATITRSLYADHVHKVVTRGFPVDHPVVRSADPPDAPTRVLIEDCGDSTHSLKFFQGTDTPAGDGSGGGRRAITAEVLRQPDWSWRVNRFAVQGLGTCG
ncbi:MAG: hypothetical protein ACRDQ1_06020 [Sciscionella sp.]